MTGYCTEIECLRLTPAMYRVEDANGAQPRGAFHLCRFCAKRMCPEGGTIHLEWGDDNLLYVNEGEDVTPNKE